MPSSENDIEFVKAFREKYDTFIQEHGVLYETLTIPMDDADRRKVKNYHLFISVFLFIFTILFFLLLYYNYPSTLKDSIYAVVFALLLITGYAWSLSARIVTLKKNTKTVIKGVVTSKKRGKDRKNYKCTIEISNKEEKTITVPDYEKLELGDVIHVEILGNPNYTIINPKVILIDRLPI